MSLIKDDLKQLGIFDNFISETKLIKENTVEKKITQKNNF